MRTTLTEERHLSSDLARRVAYRLNELPSSTAAGDLIMPWQVRPERGRGSTVLDWDAALAVPNSGRMRGPGVGQRPIPWPLPRSGLIVGGGVRRLGCCVLVLRVAVRTGGGGVRWCW